MYGKSNLLFWVYGLFLVLSTNLVVGSEGRGAEGQPVTIRFGHVRGTATFPFTLGIQRGIFRRHGVEIVSKPFADFDAVIIGLRGEEVDMGQLGMGSIVELHARGVPVKVVFGNVRMANDVLVRADSPIKDPGQLKGKRIGVFGGPSAVSGNMLMAVLQAYYGFDPRKEGNVQYGAPALLASLLQKGDVEAFLGLDPVTTIELAKGRVKSIGEIGKIYASHTGYHPFTGAISARDKFAAEHPDAVKGWLTAWIEAVRILKKDREVWGELVGSVLGTKEEKVVTMLWERLPPLWPEKWDEEIIKDEIQAMKFMARYAGTGFLEKIPASAFTTRFAPK